MTVMVKEVREECPSGLIRWKSCRLDWQITTQAAVPKSGRDCRPIEMQWTWLRVACDAWSI